MSSALRALSHLKNPMKMSPYFPKFLYCQNFLCSLRYFLFVPRTLLSGDMPWIRIFSFSLFNLKSELNRILYFPFILSMPSDVWTIVDSLFLLYSQNGYHHKKLMTLWLRVHYEWFQFLCDPSYLVVYPLDYSRVFLKIVEIIEI